VDTDKLRQDRIEAWAQVRAVFAASDELCREAKRLRAQEDGGDSGEGGPQVAGEARVKDSKGPPKSYIRRRQAVRDALVGALKPCLGRYLGELQANHCLVPLVIAIDERERLALDTLVKRWRLPALQYELLEIDDGGDRFYDQLDENLAGSGLHPLVFELYLFCLKGGFAGRYQGRETERQAFVSRLSERIRREDPRRLLAAAPGVALVDDDGEGAADGRRRKVPFLAFPYRYYVGVAGVMLALFLAMRFHSNKVVAHSPIGCACSDSAQDDPARCLGTASESP
jgi:hypothetical protein